MARVANPRIRLGRGQVTSADVTIWEARRLFLKAVYRVSPETYWSLFPDGPGEPAVDAWRARWNDDLPAMIATWQERWNLTDPWLADVAVNPLRARLRWHIQGCTALWGRDRFVVPKARPGASGGTLGLPVAELYWNPETESHEQARARLHALIDDELDRVKSTGVPATRTKSPQHFAWLARHRVLGESFAGIARDLIDDPDASFVDIAYKAKTVERAIKSTAQLIGITPPNANYSPNPKSS